MKTRETIEELLNAKEGENYQFKEWKTKDDLKEAARICCALANCGGGKLILGVTDKRPRKVVGSTAFPQPERTRVDLMNKLCVRVDFSLYHHENRRVLVFDVASRPIGLPIQTESGAWWYKGDSLIIMPEEVRRTIYAESGHDFSGDICPDLSIDHLDDGAIENFRSLWLEHTKNKRLATLSKEQLLSDCGALAEAGLTYAALILFGKPNAVARRLPQTEIIFEYRSSKAAGPAAHREDFCEGFFVQGYNRIWELVNLRNDNQHYQNRFAVHPVPTFNEKVVREAVLNAVAHRDYQLGGSIFVRQYSRKIIVESPGGFPTGIVIVDENDNASVSSTVPQALVTNAWDTLELNDRHKQILVYMTKTANTTTAQLAAHLGLSGGRIRKLLIELAEKNLIEKVGDNRYAHYVLTTPPDPLTILPEHI